MRQLQSSAPWEESLWKAYETVRDQLDRVSRTWERWGVPVYAASLPPTRLYETPQGFVLVSHVPRGYREDIGVTVSATEVTLSGVQSDDPSGSVGNAAFGAQENHFQTVVPLLEPIDPESVETVFCSGRLLLRLRRASAPLLSALVPPSHDARRRTERVTRPKSVASSTTNRRSSSQT